MKSKKPVYNQYDGWYENRRFDYIRGIRTLEEDFKRMHGAYLMYQMVGNDKWEKHEHENAIAFKIEYNVMCGIYQELEKYWNEHHEKMDKCKTWNETLFHPDEWCIRWAGGLE